MYTEKKHKKVIVFVFIIIYKHHIYAIIISIPMRVFSSLPSAGGLQDDFHFSYHFTVTCQQTIEQLLDNSHIRCDASLQGRGCPQS